MASALAWKHLSAGYGDTVVLEDIDLAVAPGESVSIIGRNGVGKTTLLVTAMGHTNVRGGEVLLVLRGRRLLFPDCDLLLQFLLLLGGQRCGFLRLRRGQQGQAEHQAADAAHEPALDRTHEADSREEGVCVRYDTN